MYDETTPHSSAEDHRIRLALRRSDLDGRRFDFFLKLTIF